MRIVLIQSYYTVVPNGVIVNLCGRAEDGTRTEIVVTGHHPRFWIREDPVNRKASIPDWANKVTKVTQQGVDMYGRPLWRIQTLIPAYVGDANKGIKKYFKYHLEADILFVNRVRIDLGIKYEFEVDSQKLTKNSDGIYVGTFDTSEVHGVDDQSIQPTYMAMDIEVSDEFKYATPDKPDAPVLCLSIYDGQTDTFHLLIHGFIDKDKAMALAVQKLQGHLPSVINIETYTTEEELFNGLINLINKNRPDIIMGWNFCRVGLKEGYDIPYLRKRANKMGYDWINEKPIMWFDLMAAAALQIGSMTYMKLDDYAKRIGLAKEKLDKSIFISYMGAREELMRYNIWDTALCVIAIKREGLLDFYLNLIKLCGCFLDDTYMKTRLVDMFILHSLSKKGVVLPSLEFMHTPEDFEGAFVSPASKGLYKDVVDLDVKAEYPSIIRTFNLSPETRIRAGEYEPNVPRYNLPSGNQYVKAPKGIMTVMLEQIMQLRENFVERMKTVEKNSQEFKNLNQQQYAMKFFINSVYGVVGSSHYRLADSQMASDITMMGQLLTKWTWKKLEALGHKPLYSDTDSVMLQMVNPTMEKAKDLAQQLTDTFPEWSKQYGGSKVEAVLEVDKLFSAWVQSGKKKRYFGWVTEDKSGRKDYLHVTGFEIKRTNIAPLTIKIQEQAFKLILAGSYTELRELLKATREDILAGKYREELMFPAKHKKIETNAAHYRAALFAKELGIALTEEDSYFWCYIQPTASVHSDVYAILPETKLPNEITIDYKKMLDRVLVKPLKSVLEAIDITWKYIITGKRSVVLVGKTLEDFA